MPSSPATGELTRSIGLFGAVALALGIVVGAGMLALPGLVYRETGGLAVLAWLADAVLVLPLLVIFAALGRKFPSAGGVAGFVGQAFPALKPGVAFVLMGTFSLGLSGIAVTGASYIANGFGLAPEGARGPIAAVACASLLLVGGLAWAGARAAGAVQNAVVTVLVVFLALVIAASVPAWQGIDFTAGDTGPAAIWSGMALAFFAYTGWELLAFTAEEMKNPKRDFPLAVAISLVLVVALYAGAALAVQALVPLDDPRLATAPFLAVIKAIFGAGLAVWVLALAVGGIILANLNAAIWAASRLVFDTVRATASSARPGPCPGTRRQVAAPRGAIAAVALVLIAVSSRLGTGLARPFSTTCWGMRRPELLSAYVAKRRRPTSIDREARVATPLFGAVAIAVCLVFAGVWGWIPDLIRRVLCAIPVSVRGFVMFWGCSRWPAGRRRRASRPFREKTRNARERRAPLRAMRAPSPSDAQSGVSPPPFWGAGFLAPPSDRSIDTSISLVIVRVGAAVEAQSPGTSPAMHVFSRGGWGAGTSPVDRADAAVAGVSRMAAHQEHSPGRVPFSVAAPPWTPYSASRCSGRWRCALAVDRRLPVRSGRRSARPRPAPILPVVVDLRSDRAARRVSQLAHRRKKRRRMSSGEDRAIHVLQAGGSSAGRIGRSSKLPAVRGSSPAPSSCLG